MDYVDGHTKNIKTFEATYLDISLVCRAKKKNKIKTYQQKATYCKHKFAWKETSLWYGLASEKQELEARER